MTRQTFSHDDVQLNCYETGSGLPLVLVHGFPLDHHMWSPQIEALRDQCRVIAPDLRGFGHSSLAEGDAEDGVEMGRYAADVAIVLEQIGVKEPAILCGFSMGGYVLWQFLRLFPERVQAFVLCDTKATADTDQARATRLQVAEAVTGHGAGPVAEAMLPKLLAPETFVHRKEVTEEVDAMIRRTNPAAISAAAESWICTSGITAGPSTQAASGSS